MTLFNFSVHFPAPEEDTPNPPASLNPLSHTKTAEYTEQSGLQPPQICSLRASKQRLAFFKQFQGHLCFSTELRRNIY